VRTERIARPTAISIAHALVWMSSAKWVAQLVGWAATIVVARLLAPEDYGLVGMAGVLLTLVSIFSEFGLGTIIIVYRDLTDEQVAQVNAVAVVVGVAALLIACASAQFLGQFFSAPRLPPIVVVTSATFVISAFRTVPYALLQRELNFRYLAIAESAQAIVIASLTVLLALLGFGYWTLVLGTVLGNVIGTALAVLGRPCAFGRPQWAALTPILTVSRQLLVGRFTNWAQMNVGSVVVGRFLGPGPLGAYSMAMSLASLPVDKITTLLNQVSSPFLAAAQADRRTVRHLILVLTAALAVVVFPIAVGMALVADTSVLALLGARWVDAVRPLQLLAIWAAFRSLAAVLAPVVVITGGVRFFMYVSIGEAALMSAAFYVGSGFGIAGVAAAWLLVYPIMRVPLWIWVFRRVEITLPAYLAALQPAIRGTALLSVSVIGIKLLSPPEWSALQQLALEIAGGVTSYAFAASLQRHKLFALYHEFRALGRPADCGSQRR
jgi:PST family polysaccharide transporter